MLPQAKPQEARMLKLHKQESKKVSLENGYTMIPNELDDAIEDFNFTHAQRRLVRAVLRKTLRYHKEMDWICDEQLAELAHICDRKEANKVKRQLVAMNVLVQDGKKIGLNLYVSEWCEITRRSENTRQKSGKNTQECRVKTRIQNKTIQNINKNTPHTSQGDDLPLAEPQAVQPDENFTKSQELVDYYNELNKTKVRDGKPFIALLKNTSSRKGYSVDEIKLVLKWVHHTWKKRSGSIPSPTNICRPTRFDGYLADAQRWAEVADFDTQAVIQAYNDILGDKLVPLDEDDTDAEQQILALLPKLAHQTVDAFSAYFRAFANNASEFYFEPSHKIGFSFLMKPETLTKVKRGEI